MSYETLVAFCETGGRRQTKGGTLGGGEARAEGARGGEGAGSVRAGWGHKCGLGETGMGAEGHKNKPQLGSIKDLIYKQIHAIKTITIIQIIITLVIITIIITMLVIIISLSLSLSLYIYIYIF